MYCHRCDEYFENIEEHIEKNHFDMCKDQMKQLYCDEITSETESTYDCSALGHIWQNWMGFESCAVCGVYYVPPAGKIYPLPSSNRLFILTNDCPAKEGE